MLPWCLVCATIVTSASFFSVCYRAVCSVSRLELIKAMNENSPTSGSDAGLPITLELLVLPWLQPTCNQLPRRFG
jgi:hypothetical protein